MSRRACSGCQRRDLAAADPRWVDEPGHVAAHQAPALRGHQGSAQDGVDVLDAARRQARGLLAVEERLDLGGGELGEGDVPEARDQVPLDDLPVALEGRGADPGPGHLVEPLAQIRPEPDAQVGDGPLLRLEPLDRGELLLDLGTAVPEDVLADAATALVADVDRACPATILALVDGALARSTTGHGAASEAARARGRPRCA